MKLLIRSAKIIDPNSPFNNKTKDISIVNGNISKIGDKISEKSFSAHQIILPSTNQTFFVSPGWLDLYCSFGDPGFEYKEDIVSGTKAAAAGGFTGIALLPNTHPVIHSKAEIKYIKNKSEGNIVDVFPLGAISQNREGKDLSEIFDMREAGAVAFSDADHPISNAGLMLRALFYVKPFDGVIYSHTDENSVSNGGTINEGKISTELGLKGIPNIAEEIMVVRDIYLAEYSNSRVHFPHISTKKSVELIRNAKTRGVKVTASVAPYHLLFDERTMSNYDSDFKVAPPLRNKEDIKALIKGLADGTIDAICTNHFPQDEDGKKVEFESAAFGMINLQTAFSLSNMALNEMQNFVQIIVDKLAIQPRKILEVGVPLIQEGEKANFTIFDTKSEWNFSEKNILSKSKNSPFIGKKLKGKVIGIVNNNEVILSR